MLPYLLRKRLLSTWPLLTLLVVVKLWWISMDDFQSHVTDSLSVQAVLSRLGPVQLSKLGVTVILACLKRVQMGLGWGSGG